MKQNRWKTRLVAGGMVLFSLTGVALATNQGTQSDPLVTLSYLNGRATPEILAQVDKKLDERERELEKKLNGAVQTYLSEVEQYRPNGGGGGSGSGDTSSAGFQVVALNGGQRITAGNGCEVLLRSGKATVVSNSAPALLDMTTGGSLSNGGALTANHLYVTPESGRAVVASGSVTLLVRGEFLRG